MEEVREIKDTVNLEDTPENRQRFALEQLDRLLQRGNLLGAKGLCEFILQHSPVHPIFNFHLGNIEIELGNYESAKSAFMLSHQYSNEINPRTLFNIGYVCFRLDEFQMAIGAYRQSLEALKTENDMLTKAGAFSIDHLPIDRIYHNLGIAQSCFACTFMEANPEKARELFHAAVTTFDEVIECVDNDPVEIARMGEDPNNTQEDRRDNIRARSSVFGHAFVNKLQALESLIELKDPQAESLEARMTEMTEYGLNSPALVEERRDIEKFVKKQLAQGIEVSSEEEVAKDIEIRLSHARSLRPRLEAILAWHGEPVNWATLIEEHNAAMRDFYERQIAGNNEYDDALESDQENLENANSGEEEPVEKKCRRENKKITYEKYEDQNEDENPMSDNLLELPEKNKAERLQNELSINMREPELFPYAFDIMLSSPEFLRLYGWCYFAQPKLGHVIHDSYTHFHDLALAYNQIITAAGLKCLVRAGVKINQNRILDALNITTEAINSIAEQCPANVPCFIEELNRPEDPEIQRKRRFDLKMIAKFSIHNFYYQAELLLGFVNQLLDRRDDAEKAFERCYSHIEALENILKSPQHTETMRQIKDMNKSVQFTRLNKVVRDCERKIPEKLKARMKSLDDFLQRDVLRLTLSNASIPFPYDKFREGFAGLNQQLGIKDGANVSDHVVSLCYLMPDGTPQVSSITFNADGVAFGLFDMARKYDVPYEQAKIAVVNKVNRGKAIFEGLDESKRRLPSLAFMNHVQTRNSFDDGTHKHSEQVYYFALDRCDPQDLITRWTQESGGKFTPECTVVAVISNMKSTKTGCPSCKCAAIATQNPHDNDNAAFLNRLHGALKDRCNIPTVAIGKPKLQMVTRIRAFTKDSHAQTHGLHENPIERSLLRQENLGIFENLEDSAMVSGYRNGIY